MKRVMLIMILCGFLSQAKAQSEEAQQLLLNVEKLAQFQKILKSMYDAYKILYKGYTTVKNISEGNFNLHKNFLDGLMQVNPVVKKYKRVVDIINYQMRIVKEYKAAFKQFREEKQFTPEEIDYIGKVYSNLFQHSVQSLDELTMIVTAGKLRMSDDERLQAIDRIYQSVGEQLMFLKEFNNNTAMLSIQRKSELADIKLSKRISGLRE